MTSAIIITLCTLLLLAYVFDITASKTKIPSVILLLLLGWGVKQLTLLLEINLPNLEPALPVLGTIGLILIVLEGSLELELSKSKLPLIRKSFVVALVPMLLLSFAIAAAFVQFGDHIPLKTALINAIPIAVISSAIAIPSARALEKENREFITYESSLSDIIGVIFFNFIALNDYINTRSVGVFILQMVIIFLISIAATLLLSWLLSKIKHHVKFIPIILLTILIYTLSKNYHLPALLLIMIFGLFLSNLEKLKKIRFFNRFKTEMLEKQVHKFAELNAEVTFLIRALFFLLFGYLINTEELLNGATIIWALSITFSIFVLRALSLIAFGIPVFPVVFIAPRGLITILLFLSIPANYLIGLNSKSLVIQVIILTALVMMTGLMAKKKKKTANPHSLE